MTVQNALILFVIYHSIAEHALQYKLTSLELAWHITRV